MTGLIAGGASGAGGGGAGVGIDRIVDDRAVADPDQASRTPRISGCRGDRRHHLDMGIAFVEAAGARRRVRAGPSVKAAKSRSAAAKSRAAPGSAADAAGAPGAVIAKIVRRVSGNVFGREASSRSRPVDRIIARGRSAATVYANRSGNQRDAAQDAAQRTADDE